MSDRRLLVAIVDDEEPVRRALRRLFLSAGIDVETFASGFELLDSAVAHQADCVVLDLHLPGLTGFDVMEQLAERAMDVPTVIVTGHNQPGIAERALVHAFAFLEKPLDARRLLDTVFSAARSRANRAPRQQSDRRARP
ncbi:MAG TPA: response regulator [Thermoanaerobaculia bacterium]|nr:response regulator [Thermoanaerobaculia bacterium]